ncbi:MAG TPA: acyl-CoA dehydrogenase family protein [Anaerolineaceae bacterium]|jgi:butyryl-CoA dehydrogenase|nr:acyl-CoA dehydrogenase family protein [Anaerolineaceae bacterium]HOH20612.1 acyl-CoA dehydrogenase family protein [Anaerolineaceae bacterium]HPA34061.1 acyl-CoA dehydrogenase family protein [Anaerolineaceae bacterium]HQO97841.1 acyl-CoA dehydrogenase family protein [Anaerolineaceae bacterium]HQP61414.1 acyl-CoA dehydrogenase family protein [Anaerolineaceae bacterium]
MYALSPQHLDLQKHIRSLVDTFIEPQAAEIDRTGEYPYDIIRILAREGIMALPIPREYGGDYRDLLSWFIVMEEVGKACGTTANILASHSLCAYVIEINGSEEQKQKFLPDLASGELIGAMAMTELQAGTDAGSLEASGVRGEDGQYVLNGRKVMIASAGAADRYVIMIKTDPTKGTKGISAFLVDKGTPGLSFGAKYETTGLRGLSVGEVLLENCVIPEDRLLGAEGTGFKAIMKSLDRTRPAVGAMAVGLAQKALELATERAKQRVQFGQPLADQQLVQAKLADMACQIDAARLLVYHAAYQRDSGVERFTRESAQAKMYASDIAMAAASEALQIFGGWGYMGQYPIERLWRDARALQLADGSNEILKLVIARSLLS